MNPKQHLESYFDENGCQTITLDSEIIEHIRQSFFREGFMDEVRERVRNLKESGFDKKDFIREHDVSPNLLKDLGQSKMSTRKFLK